jgi:hypothetical protein
MTDTMAKIREALDVAYDFKRDDYSINTYGAYIKWREEALALLDAKRPSECHWSGDEFTSDWYGDCGIEFTFIDGTPTENEMTYCPKCGGKLIDDGYPKSENDDEETP